MSDEETTTTIRISREFKEWLDKRGVKGDTYEEILRRLTGYPEQGVDPAKIAQV